MTQAAANYHTVGGAGSFLFPKTVYKKAIFARSCESVSDKAGTKNHDVTKSIFGSSVVEYPFVPRNPAFEASCGQSIDGCNFTNAETDFSTLTVQKKTIQLCHTERDMLKIDLVDWDRMESEGRGFYDMLANNHLTRQMVAIPDISNIASLIRYAAPYHRGKRAGRKSRRIDLGDTTAPLIAGSAGDGKMRNVIQKLTAVEAESNIQCAKSEQMAVLMDYASYAYLMEDYTTLKQGSCCVLDAETGMMKDVFGHLLIPTNDMPCVLDPAGNPLSYVIVVAKKDWAVPFRMHYGKSTDWQTIGHQKQLPIAYSWGSYVFDPESTAHAVVRVTPI
jgi:hypothetical protein